jgi:hypothetical protein
MTDKSEPPKFMSTVGVAGWPTSGCSGPDARDARKRPLSLSVIPIHDETKPESHIGWTDEKGPNQGVAK